MTPFSAASLVFSVYKYVVWVRSRGLQWSFVQVVILANIIGNIIRLLYSAVDPIYSRRIFPNLLNHLLSSGSWPFALTATLLISFYWQELITKTKVNVSLFVNKLKIPFWVIVANITASMLRGFYYPIGLVTLIAGAIYVVTSLAIALPILFLALKSCNHSKRVPAISSDQDQKIDKNNRTSGCIGCIDDLFAIIVAVGGLTDVLFIPWGYWAMWFSMTAVLNINSIVQVSAFNVPKQGGSSSSLNITLQSRSVSNGNLASPKHAVSHTV